MADAILARYEVPTRLIKGSRGAFDVRLGEELIFSKDSAGRFPDPGEVEELLDGRLNG